MTRDFSYDPVTAVDEAMASGETAAIFADIRETMGIPLVTSIWRGLAGMDDGLPATWALARPLYRKGLPEPALQRVIASASLPVPEPLAPTQLACVGVGSQDLQAIRAIVAAYNRLNGLNLVALAALVTPASGDAPATLESPSAPPTWPALPKLPARDEIDAETWTMVRHVNAFGATGVDAHVATLWRHLAHWPGLLALAHAGFSPLRASGAIDAATATVTALARAEGARMAHRVPRGSGLTGATRKTVEGYVSTPNQVVRMVTLGHALARWLA